MIRITEERGGIRGGFERTRMASGTVKTKVSLVKPSDHVQTER